MIEFKTLSYKNIMSCGNSPITLDLNQHSNTLVTGRNGQGKSLMLEAICFGLYGKPFRKITKNQLVNSINKKKLLVEVEFSTNGHDYKIERGIKPNVFKIYKDGDIIEEDAAVRDYQDHLEKNILKMNLDTFKQIVVLGTAGYTPFMLLPAGKRRSIIEDLLDISVFSSMLDLNKAEIKSNKEHLVKVESELDKKMDEVDIHANHMRTSNSNTETVVAGLRERISKGESGILDIDTRIVATEDAIQTLEDSLIELDMTKADSTNTKLLESMQELRQLKNRVDFFTNNSTCETCSQDIDNSVSSSVIEKSTNNIELLKPVAIELRDWLKNHGEDVEHNKSISGQISSHYNTLSVLRTKRESLESGIKDSHDQIKNVQESTKVDLSDKIRELVAEAKVLKADRCGMVAEQHCRSVVNTILADSGVKRLIIRKYIPTINNLINKYLVNLGANYNFVLDDEFNETIKSRGRDSFSYSSFSQGERCRIDIAIMFAFRGLVEARSGQSSSLLILDEVFDSAADSDGVDGIAKILNDIESNVIVISHNEKHDGAMFDRHIKINKVGNFTKLSVKES